MNKFFESGNTHFDIDTVKKLWNSTNHFFNKYKMIDSKNIVLISANPTYLKLKNFCKNNIGMNIFKCKDNKDAFEAICFFEYGKNNKSPLNLFREYTYNGKLTMWKISITVNYPFMECMGEIIKTSEQSDLCQNKNSNNAQNQIATILLTKINKNFRIDMFSDNIKHYIPDIKSNSYCDELVENFPDLSKFFSAMNLCIENSKIVVYCDNFIFDSGKETKVAITMYPFAHNGNNSIILNPKIVLNSTLSNAKEYKSDNFQKLISNINIKNKPMCIDISDNNYEKPIEKVISDILTPREYEIIKQLVKGYTNKCIAYNLNISEGTVKKILYNCYQKLGIKSRFEIIKLLYKQI